MLRRDRGELWKLETAGAQQRSRDRMRADRVHARLRHDPCRANQVQSGGEDGRAHPRVGCDDGRAGANEREDQRDRSDARRDREQNALARSQTALHQAGCDGVDVALQSFVGDPVSRDLLERDRLRASGRLGEDLFDDRRQRQHRVTRPSGAPEGSDRREQHIPSGASAHDLQVA